MNADGTDVVRITKDGLLFQTPRWSPDGTKIAFSRQRGFEDDIYVMNADGTHVVNLIKHQGENYNPDWSPDGKKIAFDRLTRHEGSNIYAL